MIGKGRGWRMVKEGAVEKDEGQIKRGVGGDRRKDQEGWIVDEKYGGGANREAQWEGIEVTMGGQRERVNRRGCRVYRGSGVSGRGGSGR